MDIFGSNNGDDDDDDQNDEKICPTKNLEKNPTISNSAPMSSVENQQQINDRKQLFINFRLKLYKYALCKNNEEAFVDKSEAKCFEKYELLRKMQSIENKQKRNDIVKKPFFVVEKCVQDKFKENNKNFLTKWHESICRTNLSTIAKNSNPSTDEQMMSIFDVENHDPVKNFDEQSSINHDEQLQIKPEQIWIGKQVEISDYKSVSNEFDKMNSTTKNDDNSFQNVLPNCKIPKDSETKTETKFVHDENNNQINGNVSIKSESLMEYIIDENHNYYKKEENEINDDYLDFDDYDDYDDENENIENLNTMTPLEKRCQELLDMNSGESLKQIKFCLSKLKLKLIQNSPRLMYYFIIIVFQFDQNYDYVIELCRMTKMPLKFHRKLQQIWDHSCEQLEIRRKGVLKLTCVQRFRLKQRNPYPETITIGDRVKYGIPLKFKKMLINYYDKVNKHPSPLDKEKLAEKTRLTVKQGMLFVTKKKFPLIGLMSHYFSL